jgi:large subunit ribosomal protein L25
MQKESKLIAEPRERTGSAEARRVRRVGKLPGVVNDDKGGSMLIMLDRHGFELMLGHHSSQNLIFDLEVTGRKPQRVLLKDVQHHPVTGTVLHADFLEISMTKKMRVRIPIILIGEPVGVSQEAGVLEQLLRELEVECLPSDLIDTINVDVSGMKLNETLPVSKLAIDPKLTILSDPKQAVAGVMEPRKEEEVVPEAAELGVPAGEPEVIGREKKEGEEEEATEEKGEEGKKEKGKEEGKKGKEEGKKGKEEGKKEAKKPEEAKKAEDPKKKEEPKKKAK